MFVDFRQSQLFRCKLCLCIGCLHSALLISHYIAMCFSQQAVDVLRYFSRPRFVQCPLGWRSRASNRSRRRPNLLKVCGGKDAFRLRTQSVAWRCGRRPRWLNKRSHTTATSSFGSSCQKHQTREPSTLSKMRPTCTKSTSVRCRCSLRC